jgi:hypothetical protein
MRQVEYRGPEHTPVALRRHDDHSEGQSRAALPLACVCTRGSGLELSQQPLGQELLGRIGC